MSKKRTRDVANNTTEVEMHVSNKNVLQKCEQAKLQNIPPVCILFKYVLPKITVLVANIELLKLIYYT
jgi:hypothetical protein